MVISVTQGKIERAVVNTWDVSLEDLKILRAHGKG